MKLTDKISIVYQAVVTVATKWRELDDEFWRDLEKRLDEVEKKKGNQKAPAPAP
jgi:hypothetical protein